jgi:RNA polymerase sigma factor (sigma-70 family)
MNIEKLVTDYLPLADKLARHESSKFPNSVSLDEVKSAAYMGLVDAANKFDPDRNVPFGAYARTRIVGEIRDYIRFLLKSSGCSELDEESCPAPSSDHSATEDFFAFVCDVLGPSDGKIIHMYYVDDRTLGEIGISKGVSESRISQIMKKIHRRLKCVLS